MTTPDRMSTPSIKQELDRLGFVLKEPDTLKMYRCEIDDAFGCFYLKPGTDHPLTIHPNWKSSLENNPVNGIKIHYKKDEFYFNSAQRRFPVLVPGRERCGLAVAVRDHDALRELLGRIRQLRWSTHPSPDLLEDLEDAKESLARLDATEREAVVKARLGQGLFRQRLLARWDGRCVVTGLAVAGLLRASHIKPWRKSTNEERLDPDNGLLLTPGLDHAFDVGLITFDEDGAVRLSDLLSGSEWELYGLSATMALSDVTEGMRPYLNHHRTEEFKHGRNVVLPHRAS